MKKLLVTGIFMFSAFLMYAQKTVTTTKTKTETPEKVKQVPNPAAYACPKCYDITKGAGKCTKCGVDKVQLGTYYCPSCMKSTGGKPGKCPSCSGATVQMTRKYVAGHGMKKDKPKDENKM